ncbi:S-layer homology domain-containing protein [uncultured Flavonifractor sp.]|uniref:S-layer homology domain-containing protein n=1 Tax=uncultured Flavonifractor sp. TaxID=1193534 RepID=UPI00349FD950
MDSSLTNRVEEDVKVNRSSVTLYAKWSLDSADPDNSGVSDWLETEEHRAYLQGYGNGNFGPTDKMTRAEVAQMFYNLLKDQDVPVTVTFTDVPEEAWYRDAVQALASLGIVEGIGNGKFAPERTITRAEFTAIAMRFTNGALDGENIFSDVSEDEWFYEEVVGSIQYGWINGYTDGTFRPYNNIARSEVTAITNRMLGRSADEAFVDGHADELRQFPDVSKDVWGYYEIMEATNTHDYTKDTDGETWSDLG